MNEAEALKAEITAFLQDLINYAKKNEYITKTELMDAVSRFFIAMNNPDAGKDDKNRRR